jgi:hypothetical protein
MPHNVRRFATRKRRVRDLSLKALTAFEIGRREAWKRAARSTLTFRIAVTRKGAADADEQLSSWRVVPIVTLPVTHRGTEAGALEKHGWFAPHFQCGGMAERSMAVVLKPDPADPRNSRFSVKSRTLPQIGRQDRDASCRVLSVPF